MVGVMLDVGRAKARGALGPALSVLAAGILDAAPAPSKMPSAERALAANIAAAALVVKSSSSSLRMMPVVSVLTSEPKAR